MRRKDMCHPRNEFDVVLTYEDLSQKARIDAGFFIGAPWEI